MSVRVDELVKACMAAKMKPEEIGRVLATATAAKPASTEKKAYMSGPSKAATGGAGTGPAPKAVDGDQKKVASAIENIFDKATDMTAMCKMAVDGISILHVKLWEKDRKPLNPVLCLNRKFVDKLHSELDVDPLAVIYALNNEVKEHMKKNKASVLADLKENWTKAYSASALKEATGFDLERNSFAKGLAVVLTADESVDSTDKE